jgi:hypothetical protein
VWPVEITKQMTYQIDDGKYLGKPDGIMINENGP